MTPARAPQNKAKIAAQKMQSGPIPKAKKCASLPFLTV